ncbi:WYL domain-containing protein [Achromobacter denitrificans]
MPVENTRRASAKGEKLAQRLSHILALLHQGDAIDKHQLALDFQVDVRTIERDLGERLLHIAERNGDGRWQLTHAARSTVPARNLNDYAQLAGTQYLFPDPSLRFLLEQLQTPAAKRAVHVQPAAQEDLRGRNTAFSQLQQAIQAQHECRFEYKDKPRRVQPYRLIHKNGIWYLAATEDGRLKNFSVSRIGALHVDAGSRFTPDPAHHEYINNKDDVWFTPDTLEVLLRVSPEAAHYFTRRPLLPQQLNRTGPDGSLLVTTQISHPQQLLPLVRYWLPHVRILQPAALRHALLESLQDAIASWEQE